MSQDATVKDKAFGRSKPDQSISERPLRKKRSLTSIFTSSKSSSKSRAPSPEDPQVPTTPTIPQKFLPASRKASHHDDTPTSGDGRKQSAQSVLSDVTNISASSNRQSSPQTQGLRGILKHQRSSPNLPSNVLEQERGNVPFNQIPVRSRTSSTTQKRRGQKSTVYHSPNSPTVAKASESRVNVADAVSPNTRNRGASTTSLGLSRFRDLQTKADVPPRPSTSGGERSRRQSKDTIIEREGQGLGLSLGLTSEHHPLGEEEVRASFRSAITTNSSVVGASTSRSSIATKDTSISDVPTDSSPNDAVEEGMTVDEAIGMYENGFVDDVDSDLDHPSGSSISEEERRRSMRIAEAISDSIGSDIIQSTQASASASRAKQSNTTAIREPDRAPPIMPPTTARDQYGFLKANRYISSVQYDMWNSMYSPDQLRRTKKWFTYMREQGCTTYRPDQFPDRSPKTLRYIRKGIPPAWRGAAWLYYSGGSRLLEENPGTYSSLLSKVSELGSDDAESIERDLHRTFPDNIHFKPDIPTKSGTETPLLSSLRRVLQAFAIYRPQIGYCQSLNFLAGLLLLFLPEEKAFWMLHIITTIHLPGTHEVSLEGANVDLWVLMLALKESSPSIWAKVGVGDEDVSSIHTARLPPISLCTTSWFMSMFIGTLPIESVLRVWDIVFYEGSKMLFRIALAIFKMGEQSIRSVNDSMELFQVVQAFPRGILDVGSLVGMACRRGGISQEWITKKRKERRKWYAVEKKGRVTGGAAAAVTTPIESPAGEASPSDLSRANSAWRRTVGLVR